MADSIQFVVELADKMSAPAKAAGAAVGGLTSKLGGVGLALEKVAPEGLTSGLEALKSSGSEVSGVFASLGADLGAFAGPVGIAAAAIGVLTAATVGLIAAGAKFALTQSDEKRSLILSLESITGSAESARGLEETMQAVSKIVPTSREQIDKFGRSLALAGISGDTFEQTLRSLATVQSAAGDEAADKIKNIIEKTTAIGQFKIDNIGKALKGTGITADTLTKALATKLGVGTEKAAEMLKAGTVKVSDGIAALNGAISGKLGDVASSQLLSLGTQFQKFKENVGDLFEDVEIEPFLKGLHDVLSIFDSTTQTGATMKKVITEVFNSIFTVASKVFPYVKVFLLGMLLALIRVHLFLKQIAPTLKEAFSYIPDLNWLGLAGTLGKSLLYVLLALAGAFAVVIGLVLLAASPFIALVAAIGLLVYAVVAGVSWIIDAISELGPAAVEAAGNFISGLVDGITNGVGFVVDAIKGLAGSALTAFKSVFGIASPSKVMAQMGGDMTAGLSMGLDSGADKAQASLAGVVSPAQAAGGGGSSGKGTSVDIGGVTITINGVAGAEQIAEILPQQLAQAFENLAMQMGRA